MLEYIDGVTGLLRQRYSISAAHVVLYQYVACVEDMVKAVKQKNDNNQTMKRQKTNSEKRLSVH